MKFLVDAQLPRRLVLRLREAGHDAVHTLDLPNGNRTSDDIQKHQELVRWWNRKYKEIAGQ